MSAAAAVSLPLAHASFNLDLALARGRYRLEEGVWEKRCSRCREYWPADLEFFYSAPAKGDGLHTYCKACYNDVRGPRHQKPQTGLPA